MQGRRAKQEDRKFVMKNLAEWQENEGHTHIELDPTIFDLKRCRLFGVLDGHCGSLAADWATETIPLELMTRLSHVRHTKESTKKVKGGGATDHPSKRIPVDQPTEEPTSDNDVSKNDLGNNIDTACTESSSDSACAPDSSDEPCMDAAIDSQICRALTETFEAVDEKFLLRYRTSRDGCAASVVLVINDRKVFAAGLGDSRVIMVHRKDDDEPTTIELTTDHKPSLDSERKRVEEAGGLVVDVNNVKRVALSDYQDKCRQIKMSHARGEGANIRPPVALAVSRALGDRDFKIPTKLILATPCVSSYNLETHGSSTIVMACDGVWDVLTNEGVAKLTTEGTEVMTKQILLTAYNRGSQDNLTMVAATYGTPSGEETVEDATGGGEP
eukprot:GHVO01068010.1.p1 GENE.GHVO01068010.1~~GHVO01068010.1.p1  ORF type:complete len:386 (+),score=70.15 GHVO01068010.1:267-1424(+)